MPVPFDQLFPSQKRIVCHSARALLVLAGPGTGKTEVLTHRIAYLINKLGASPDEILAVTFSRKAANEMSERLKNSTDVDNSKIRISTLHAESLRILHIMDQAQKFLASDNEVLILMQDAIDDIGMSYILRCRECVFWVRLRKAENKLPHEIPEQDKNNSIFKQVYNRYEEILDYNQAGDLDGLVMNVLRCSYKDKGYNNFPNIKYLLVDEYQDINEAEHQLIQLLARNALQVFVVGDDDQSIYGWRGADPSIIRGFKSDFKDGQVEILQESARCTDHIIQGARAIVSRDPGYLPKPLRSARGEGNPIHILSSGSESGEAYWIANWIGQQIFKNGCSPKQIVIIGKRPDLAEPVVEHLRRRRINTIYWRSKGLFSDDSIREILAYLRLIIDRSDNLALRTCLESRSGWGIGKKGINRLRRTAEAEDRSFWYVMRNAARYPDLSRWRSTFESFTKRIENLVDRSENLEIVKVIDLIARGLRTHRLRNVEKFQMFVSSLPSELSLVDFIQEIHKNRGLDIAGGAPEPEEEIDAVSIMSMHSAKGLTYDIVFILGMEEGSIPDPRQDEGEQRRLLYVAMTRARKELFLCYAKRRIGPPAKGFSFFNPSRFINEIPVQHRDYINNT